MLTALELGNLLLLLVCRGPRAFVAVAVAAEGAQRSRCVELLALRVASSRLYHVSRGIIRERIFLTGHRGVANLDRGKS